MNRVRIRSIFGAALLATAVAAGSTVASAEPGGTPPPAQEPTVGSADAVDAVAEQLTAYELTPGYGKVSVDYANAEVSVLWKGAPPADVETLEGTGSNGVTVTIDQARYSEEELIAAGRLILETEMVRVGEGVVSAVVPNSDRSGLIVEIVGGTSLARSATNAASLYTDLTAIPTVTKVVEGIVTPTTRQNDSAPWQGGGAMANANGNDYCSTGFAILLDNGQGRLLSAAHCNSAGDTVRDGTGQVIGPVSARAPGYDSLLINPNASPATIGKVFGGPWNAGTGHNRYQFFVGGASGPAVNQTVCTSGARSGEHCNRTIRDTGVTWSCNGTTCTGFRARGDGDGVSVAGGDSGGPIYDPLGRPDGRKGHHQRRQQHHAMRISGRAHDVLCQRLRHQHHQAPEPLERSHRNLSVPAQALRPRAADPAALGRSPCRALSGRFLLEYSFRFRPLRMHQALPA